MSMTQISAGKMIESSGSHSDYKSSHVYEKNETCTELVLLGIQ